MTAAALASPEDLLAFWFSDAARPSWFEGDAAFDALLRERFGPLASAAAAGGLAGWAATPRGALALVILLDQLPRNLHRGGPLAFARDAKARAVAADAVARGLDAPDILGPEERHFLYLPFEHSEDLADQDRAVALIGALGDPEWTGYAESHRAVIREFGRFPHRNGALGRASTPAEEGHLADPNTAF